MLVLEYINSIIEFDKAVSGDLTVGDENCQDETEAEQDIHLIA